MKARVRGRKQVRLEGQVFTLSFAKTFLGRLAEKASQGEPVYIVGKNRRYVLQEIPEIQPIPMRPPGFFKDIYTQGEIAEDNVLAKSSVVKRLADVE